MTGLSRSLQLAEAGFERSVLKATDTTRLAQVSPVVSVRCRIKCEHLRLLFHSQTSGISAPMVWDLGEHCANGAYSGRAKLQPRSVSFWTNSEMVLGITIQTP